MSYKIKQIQSKSLENVVFDAAFYSCGYEQRSIFLKQKFDIKASSNIVFMFSEENRLSFNNNKKFYEQDKGNKFIISNGEKDEDIFDILSNILDYSVNDEVNLLIDYSSMTSIWFSSFISYFKYYKQKKSIMLYFSYSHAEYLPPPETHYENLSVDPLGGFTNLSIPDKPTALIIGLGYEKNKATGLAQYLDAESYIFYSDNTYGEKFSKSVILENSILINEVKKENIFTYPITDIVTTSNILHSLIIDLLQTNRIVLAPCGPKIFTLLCLLESVKNDNVDVWRISASRIAKNVIDKVADGTVSVCVVTIEDN